MKVLVVKIPGIASNEKKENIKEEIKRQVKEGIIVHDQSVELQIMDFKKVKFK